jgi:hypothetical protein
VFGRHSKCRSEPFKAIDGSNASPKPSRVSETLLISRVVGLLEIS